MISNYSSLYKTWAPNDSQWAAWAKPVLFASMKSWLLEQKVGLNIPEIPFKLDSSTMIIVDLPGKQSVDEALAYAIKGWLPVPLYNGVLSSGHMCVEVDDIAIALQVGAETLKRLSLPQDAPPVFMLDSERMKGSVFPGVFDNRWCVFPQDMPSASYLISKGIERIIVRTEHNIREDLERILYDYQKKGILLYVLTNNSNVPAKAVAYKLRSFRGVMYRFAVISKLRRNSTGGFGGIVPLPNEGNGRIFYGYG